jgi:phytanoyl-CoA dioxygenase PhyH
MNTLIKKGIAILEPAYLPDELATLNAKLDDAFSLQSNVARSYVHSDDLMDLGLFELIFGDRIRDAMLSIMPDPVLYHCHAYEIAAQNAKSHIFDDNAFGGWHRDADSELVRDAATHVSIFVYLSDVGPEDGPFEFIPQYPTDWLTASTPCASMRGAAGTTFAWQRSFYHRAAPNRGSRRRRLLKFSIQRNCYRSAHLENEHFSRVRASLQRGDDFLDVLFGRYQGATAPVLPARSSVHSREVAATGKLDLAGSALLKGQIRQKGRDVKSWLGRKSPNEKSAAYD